MYKNDYVQKKRDGYAVWVRKDLDGKEKGYSACEKCVEKNGGDEFNNCGYLNELRSLYEAWGITAVIWECPYRNVEKQNGWTCGSCGAVQSEDNTLCSYCGQEAKKI